MDKQALIHVHALLLEVARYLADEEGMPVDALAAYHAQPTRPTSLHRSKTAHREAVAALLADLGPWIEVDGGLEPSGIVRGTSTTD